MIINGDVADAELLKYLPDPKDIAFYPKDWIWRKTDEIIFTYKQTCRRAEEVKGKQSDCLATTEKFPSSKAELQRVISKDYAIDSLQ